MIRLGSYAKELITKCVVPEQEVLELSTVVGRSTSVAQVTENAVDDREVRIGAVTEWIGSNRSEMERLTILDVVPTTIEENDIVLRARRVEIEHIRMRVSRYEARVDHIYLTIDQEL